MPRLDSISHMSRIECKWVEQQNLLSTTSELGVTVRFLKTSQPLNLGFFAVQVLSRSSRSAIEGKESYTKFMK